MIGQNIGTVATAVLASVGATISAKRTAAVHVIFNVVTAVVAFFGLMPLTLYLVEYRWVVWDSTVVIAVFHTAFSLVGAMIFMPFTGVFQYIIEKLLPEKDIPATRFLDDSLFSLPAVAISTAERALCQSLAQVYTLVIQAGKGEISGADIDVQALDDTLGKVDDYLKKMPVPQAQSDQQHLIDLLRLVVYSRVIREDLAHAQFIDVLRQGFGSDRLMQVIHNINELIGYLNALPDNGLPRVFVSHFVASGDSLKAEKDDLRTSIVEQTAAIDHNASDALQMMTAQRWLDRLMKHTAKMVILLADDKKRG